MTSLKKISLASWGLRTLARHGWPKAVIHFAAGVGDELMLTAVIRELRRRGSPRFWVMSRRPELYRHNPDVASILPVDPRVLALARRCGAVVVEPRYTLEEGSGNLRPPPAHIITCLMATAGISGSCRLVPILNLTAAEKNEAQGFAGALVLQPFIHSAVRPNLLKEWWPDRWQAVVDALRPRFPIVQLGGEKDPLLQGVEDWRSHRSTLRNSAAILSQARLFVGLPSGMMHLARAMDCPGVILYGGREQPEQSGYSGFVHLVRSPICSPCWRYTGCELDRQCMSDISVADVVAAIQGALAQPKSALPDPIINLTVGEQQRIVTALAR